MLRAMIATAAAESGEARVEENHLGLPGGVGWIEPLPVGVTWSIRQAVNHEG